jgi:hypothetical protein
MLGSPYVIDEGTIGIQADGNRCSIMIFDPTKLGDSFNFVSGLSLLQKTLVETRSRK